MIVYNKKLRYIANESMHNYANSHTRKTKNLTSVSHNKPSGSTCTSVVDPSINIAVSSSQPPGPIVCGEGEKVNL